MAETTTEPTAMDLTKAVLPKLWDRVHGDGAAPTELEREALDALNAMHTEVQRYDMRIAAAKRKAEETISHLDGVWG